MLVLKDCLVFEMRDYLLLLIIIYRIKFSDVGFFVILCFIYFVFKIIKIICKEIYWRILYYLVFIVFLFKFLCKFDFVFGMKL